MELKSYEIIGMYKTLEKLTNADVSFKTAVKLAKNVNELSTAAKLADQKQQELIKEYGKKDENGEIKPNEDGTITLENPNDYYSKLQDILNSEIEVDLHIVDPDEFENVKLSANDYNILKAMFEAPSATEEEKTEE